MLPVSANPGGPQCVRSPWWAEHWSALRVSQCWPVFSLSPGWAEHWSALRVSQCYQCQPISGIEHRQIERPDTVSSVRSLNLRVFDHPSDWETSMLPVSAHPEASNTLRSEGVRCYQCQPIPGLEHWSALRVSQCYQGQPIPGIEHPQIERPQCYLCQPIPRIEHPQMWETSMLPVSAHPRHRLNTGQHWESLNADQCSAYHRDGLNTGQHWETSMLPVSAHPGCSITRQIERPQCYLCQPIPRIEHSQIWGCSMLPVSAYHGARTLVSIESLSMLTSVQPIPGIGWHPQIVALRSLNLRVFDPRDRLTLVALMSVNLRVFDPRDGLTLVALRFLNLRVFDPRDGLTLVALRSLNVRVFDPRDGLTLVALRSLDLRVFDPRDGLTLVALRSLNLRVRSPWWADTGSIEVSQSEGVRSPG